jgi:acyl carrier protein
VIAREDGNGNTRLVAYVVPREGARVDVQELRALARRELPGYMVPGLIQGVEALPLTPSGKLDARALPALETSRPQLDVALVPARSATEKSIAACWAGVLGVAELGIHDNFFELGGYSLLAIQVIARLKQSLGVELSPRDLFEKPTIAELAELVMGRLGAGSVAPEAPLEIVAGGIEQFSDSEVADLLQQMLVPPT